MGGLFGGSSSQSSSQEQTNVTQQFSDDASAFTFGDLGNKNEVSLTAISNTTATDFGSVDKAFGFGEHAFSESIDFAGNTAEGAFSLASDNQSFLTRVLDVVLGNTEKATARQADFNQGVIQDAISFARDSTSAGNVATDRAISNNVILAAAAVSLTALYLFWRRK